MHQEEEEALQNKVDKLEKELQDLKWRVDDINKILQANNIDVFPD